MQDHTTVRCTIFPPFSYTCYSAVQHTLYHVSVCTILFPILDMPIWSIPLCHQTVYILHLLSVSVCNIFVAWYLVCNAWSFAAIISLPASSFRYPLNSNRNVSSPPISSLSTLLIHWPWSTLLSYFIFKDSPTLLLPVECLLFCFIVYVLIGLIILQHFLLFHLLI